MVCWSRRSVLTRWRLWLWPWDPFYRPFSSVVSVLAVIFLEILASAQRICIRTGKVHCPFLSRIVHYSKHSLTAFFVPGGAWLEHRAFKVSVVLFILEDTRILNSAESCVNLYNPLLGNKLSRMQEASDSRVDAEICCTYPLLMEKW